MLSARSLESLLNIIHKYDVDPDEIELEITESILIDDFSALSPKKAILKSAIQLTEKKLRC